MNLYKSLTICFSVLAALAGCQSIPDKDWTGAVPRQSPFVIVPAEGATLESIFESEFIPLLEDVTSSALQLAAEIDTAAANPVPVNAIVLYPGANRGLQPIFLLNARGSLTESLKQYFSRPFTQNNYYFNGIEILKLHIGDRILFAAHLRRHLLVSESSLAMEDAIRSYLGVLPAADLSSSQIRRGTLVMNTPSLDKWVEQVVKVNYRPMVIDAVKGTGPAVLELTRQGTEQNVSWMFSGSVPVKPEERSTLVAALSSRNAPLELDRYISSDAAGFGIFRLNPRLAPPVSVPDTTRLDSVLMSDKILYSNLATPLAPNFALVLYAESGFLSTGEHLFIRKLNNRGNFQQAVNELVNRGLIERRDGSYLVRSNALADMLGSELCTFSDFYLDITGDAAVISQRKGLAERVATDRNRRRVIYYEQAYLDLKEQFPDEPSGLFLSNTEFNSFIQPFLYTDNYLDALTSKFDLLSFSAALDETGSHLDLTLETYTIERSTRPFEEKWIFPTGGAELSGKPVLADIGGSAREEIIFATRGGSVYALAADGTRVLHVNTGDDEPVGPPVVYDWYGTGQNVVLIAAGNKIYGWNDTGALLPKFPFELNERITTPLTVQDVDQNGLPNAVIATADRRLHVLDGRGTNIQGWPVTTNATITAPPLVDYFMGGLSVLAFSENAMHAWFQDGVPKNGYPKFVNASLAGSPVVHNGNIYGGGADGHLYAAGRSEIFSDSLNVYSTSSDSLQIEAIYVSNSALNGSPSFHSMGVRANNRLYSGNKILAMSSNGSVFLLQHTGELLFTQSMGQPSAPEFSPFIADLDGNGQDEIIALGSFGRLYAWEISSGERLYELPTTGMKYPVVADLDGDGFKEVFAQTSTGLRCWTIY